MLLGLVCASVLAGDVRYDYDELGRLVRVTDEQGRAAVYLYGPTGNLVQILREDTPAGAPSVASVTPNVVRRAQARVIQIAGTNLLTARVTAADPKLILSIEQASASALTVKVVAASDATLGASTLTLTNSVGSANTSVQVREPMVLSTAPAPIVLPPDSLSHAVVVRLSDTEPVTTSFAMSGGTAGIVTVPSTTVNLPAGQAEFQISVTGIQAGRSSFNAVAQAISVKQDFPLVIAANSAPTSRLLGVMLPSRPGSSPVALPSRNLGVYLTPLASPAPVQVPSLNFGVYLGAPAAASSVSLPARNVGVLVSPSALGIPAFAPAPRVGVAYGTVPLSVAPATLGAGTSIALTLSGYALAGVTGISFYQSSGMTVGTPLVQSLDQTQLTVPISAGCSAALQPREVIATTSSGRIEFANQFARIVTVTGMAPTVASLDPTVGAAGSALTLTVQGANLACASSVLSEPSQGITFTSSPVVSADGTTLTISVSITSNATAGARVIRVATPFGTSTATGSGANTLTVQTP